MGALLQQFMNKYPYTDFHELNADWLIKTLMEMINQVENFVSLNAIKYADPIQWDIVRQYEKNTVVIDPLTGTAYISVQPVPSGVALTRTEYWTVVFDLGSFVVRAAKNFSNRYEADTTLTATFPSSQGDWLVWGDTLYEVIVPTINAGDQYVVGSNIRHITMEEVATALAQAIDAVDTKVGDLANLPTTDKSSIVNSIIEAFNIASEALLNTNNLRIKNVLDYGAVGDGAAIDTVAFQSWLDDLTENDIGFIPAGNYIISAPLTAPNIDNLTIHGTENSKLIANFATGDILTFGGLPRKRNLQIDSLVIDSSISRSGGCALKIVGYQNYARISNIKLGNYNSGITNLYDGIVFEETNITYFHNFIINVKHVGLTVSGAPGNLSPDSSDLFVSDGFIIDCDTGILCGGGFGGLYISHTLVFGGTIGYLQNNSICNLANREIMLSNTMCIDGSDDSLIRIEETTGSDIFVNINAFLSGAGYYADPSIQPYASNIKILGAPYGRINIDNCTIKGSTGNGIYVDDLTAVVMIGSSCTITENSVGVSNSNNSINIYCEAFIFNNSLDWLGGYNPSFKPKTQPHTVEYDGSNLKYFDGSSWQNLPDTISDVHYVNGNFYVWDGTQWSLVLHYNGGVVHRDGNNQLQYFDGTDFVSMLPNAGDVRYDIATSSMQYYDGSTWQNV